MFIAWRNLFKAVELYIHAYNEPQDMSRFYKWGRRFAIQAGEHIFRLVETQLVVKFPAGNSATGQENVSVQR